MSSLLSDNKAIRRSFGKIEDIVPVPDLIEIQSKSFNDFVQLDHLSSERRSIGLEKALRDIFPINYNDKMSLEFISYELGDWSCTCGKLQGIANRYEWTCTSCGKSDCSRLSSEYECKFCHKKTARYKRCSVCMSRVSVKVPMTLEECRYSGQTFYMPLKIKVQLVGWDKDPAGNKIVRDIKEQDVFFADIPVMADIYEKDGRFKLGDQGTFLINGIDRVVVSQLHKSPGVVFTQSKKVKDVRGRPYYLARIIPMRGSWIDFEFDTNDILHVRIDKKKKMLVSTFLQALGIPREEIISLFYRSEMINFSDGKFFIKVDNSLRGTRIEKGMLPDKKEASFLGRRVDKAILAQLKKAGIDKIAVKETKLLNRAVSEDLIDPETGEILIEQGRVISEQDIDNFKKYKNLKLKLISSSGYVFQPTMALTLAQDRCNNQEQALKEVHLKMWPGDSSSIKDIKERLENLFFNSRFYDLTLVGRVRMNNKLNLSVPKDVSVLTKEDIVKSIKYLIDLRERGEGELDDIDHLGNRRVRLVGELLTNQVYVGLLRIERIVQERFRTQDIHGALMPQDLLNIKPLSAVIREFFGSGQLSQFLDQTNPLSEVAHKRRLSALGPGGVMKDRATYEIRDVHTSHYGRICPIETPEGQTVGLISSLATYAMVNDLGFIETAYRKVKNSEIQDKVEFLNAFEEESKHISQLASIDKKTKRLKGDRIVCRYRGNLIPADLDEIDYVDLSPRQLVSVSTALIPFLEHDDASRALMGSNMQRQAVPLVRCEAPLVGTGMEKEIVKASGAVLKAKRAGIVKYVSSEKIIIASDENEFRNTDDWLAQGVDVYNLKKFKKSSYYTWIHQTPMVKIGDKVEFGQLLTNGPAIKDGELALGSNLLVAFMPWHGYNFEDAIVLSKRLVCDDSLTSVHIEEFVVEARDTKLGPEEITKDIPNVSEIILAGLDEDGIVRVGTRVEPGNILVGKVTLKGDVQYSPEEKLLRAIFGEKSREVRDTSLRVSPGVDGTVVDVRIFSRSGIRKDKRYKDVITKDIEKLENNFNEHVELLKEMTQGKIVSLLTGQTSTAKTSKSVLKDKTFDTEKLKEVDFDILFTLKSTNKNINEQLSQLQHSFETQKSVLSGLKEEEINKLKKGDPLPPGVIKMVKIYVAMRRSISVGDKLAGRHGNKGVVSTIVPREDMPYLEDGTAIDIVLNPLGVPSRMNVGQILETNLGFAGKKLGEQLIKVIQEKGCESVKKDLIDFYGKKLIDKYEDNYGKEGLMDLAKKTAKNGVLYETPIFDGAVFEKDISPLLKEADLPQSGAFCLLDGRTGNSFDQPVTVGVIYVMKLNHMVDDKLHARSVGPYSLVTQQPLGGKSQRGGQRFGEMEVWALEAYGAAYTLQEMLTYKSDDVSGRHKVYDSIVKGEGVPDPGLPESFNVLIKELQSLSLKIDLFKSGKEEVSE